MGQPAGPPGRASPRATCSAPERSAHAPPRRPVRQRLREPPLGPAGARGRVLTSARSRLLGRLELNGVGAKSGSDGLPASLQPLGAFVGVYR